jgi:hypothetical protein
MGGFFTSLFDELSARRGRLRASLGDRGQALASFVILAGLMLGSLGLYLRPWMIDVSAWGFAVPAVFVVGYLLIEVRRQMAVAAYKRQTIDSRAKLDAAELAALRAKARAQIDVEEEDLAEIEATFDARADVRHQERLDGADAAVSTSYDWMSRLFSLACALAGAAAFTIAFTSEPPPPQTEEWAPPENAVSVDIQP